MKLKQYRESAGLTQGQVAKSLGVRAETISHYETGFVQANPAVLKQLAKLYMCKISDLIKEDDEEDPLSMADWCVWFIRLLEGNDALLKSVHTFLKFRAKDWGIEKY